MDDGTANMDELTGLKTVERHELWEWVHASIRDAIILGKMPQKTRLIEDDIASKLGVSRWPVRQAITRLEQEGLVERLPHRGAYVIALDAEEATRVYALRILLECFAAKAAAVHIQPEHLLRLRDITKEHVETAKNRDYLGYCKMDTEFHRTILLISESKRLIDMWELLLPAIQVLVVMGAREDQNLAQGIQERHEEIILALSKKDDKIIEAAIRKHLVEAEARALRMLKKIGTESARRSNGYTADRR